MNATCDHTLGLACYNDEIDKEIKRDNIESVKAEYEEYDIDWFKFCPRCGDKLHIQ